MGAYEPDPVYNVEAHQLTRWQQAGKTMAFVQDALTKLGVHHGVHPERRHIVVMSRLGGSPFKISTRYTFIEKAIIDYRQRVNATRSGLVLGHLQDWINTQFPGATVGGGVVTGEDRSVSYTITFPDVFLLPTEPPAPQPPQVEDGTPIIEPIIDDEGDEVEEEKEDGVDLSVGEIRPTHAHGGERIGEASNPGPSDTKLCSCLNHDNVGVFLTKYDAIKCRKRIDLLPLFGQNKRARAIAEQRFLRAIDPDSLLPTPEATSSHCKVLFKFQCGPEEQPFLANRLKERLSIVLGTPTIFCRPFVATLASEKCFKENHRPEPDLLPTAEEEPSASASKPKRNRNRKKGKKAKGMKPPPPYEADLPPPFEGSL